MRYLVTLLFAALTLNAVGQIQYDFPYNPDADNDAFVSSTDLLELLAIYGEAFSTDELYLSQDSTSLIVYVGDLSRFECASACSNLSGNWQIPNPRNLVKHYLDLVPETILAYDPLGISESSWDYMWVSDINPTSNFRSDPRPWFLTVRARNKYGGEDGGVISGFEKTTSSNDDLEVECWCVTHQRPKVEWHRISNNDFESNKDELSQNGWRLHTIDSGDGKYLFWRWAE